MQAIIRLAYGRVFIIKDGVLWQRVYRVEGVPLAAIPMCLRGEKKTKQKKNRLSFYYFLLICLTIVAACDKEMGPREKKWMQGKCETRELMEGDRSGNET